MNSNMMLKSGETILVLTDTSGGKSVNGARVFKEPHEFIEWAQRNGTLVESTAKVGEVVHEHDISYGKKAGMKQVHTCTKEGWEYTYWGYQAYVASKDEPPVRFVVTPKHFGKPEYKTKVTHIPST